ncbi:MAG TPA: nuclear transport factor 2 family protein [Acidimicrobiales bacterium]|nr:nuclear transport factor 2 family protein [Acidimicrobiales bacterium]
MTDRYPETAVDDTSQLLADRAALRDLVDAYARHVDRRDAEAVAALFTADGRLVSRLHNPAADAPIVRRGRDEIATALVAGLDRYIATTHIVGGQVVALDGDRASGDTVSLAHHVYETAGTRRMLVMAVRYTDTYARQPGGWGFAERQLHLDWREDRPLEDRS